MERFLAWIVANQTTPQKLGFRREDLKLMKERAPFALNIDKMMSSTSSNVTDVEDGKIQIRTDSNYLELAKLEGSKAMGEANGDMLLGLLMLMREELPTMKFFSKSQQAGAREIFIVQPLAKVCLGLTE